MARRYHIPDPPPQAMRCHHSGCEAEGLYRAPKSPDQLNQYLWFCLDHVREYNKSWDFYAGMNTDQIEKQVRGKRTVTSVARLDDRERVEEISRMIGGAAITDATRATAKDLLAYEAKGERRKRK